jgi:predicted Zn-dependent protease
MTQGRILVLLFAALPLAAQQPLTGGRGVSFYGVEKEAALGERLAAELRGRTTPIDNRLVQDYVDRLGARLAAQLPAAGFTFHMVAEECGASTHEPAWLPGGHIFVPAALFLEARGEAEFAGMLAHAMVHVSERHWTRQATRMEMTGQTSAPLIFLGGGDCGSDTPLAPLAMVNLQRGYERDADVAAIQAMARAGFDPDALVRYVERTQPPQAAGSATIYSTSAGREQRIAVMSAAIAKLAPSRYEAADSAFTRVRDQVRSALPPPRPAPSLKRQ